MKPQYLAYIPSVGNSGFKDTEEEAKLWAEHQLQNNMKAGFNQVYFLKSYAVLKPIVPKYTLERLEEPAPLHNEEQVAEKQNGMRHPVHGAHERLGSDDFVNMA